MPRKSGYTPELGDRIIALMSEGKSLRDIAKEPGMPDAAQLCRWADKAELSDQEFPQRYARARIFGCHAQFEQIREIEDQVLAEEFSDPQNARIALDSIKWRLSKMLPGVYGERTHIEHSGSLKVETVKDHAPEWLQEMLTKPAAQTAGDEETETVH